jgi:hypothetical protein
VPRFCQRSPYKLLPSEGVVRGRPLRRIHRADGLLLPVMPAVSIAGSWIAKRWMRVSLAFVALPWIYCAAFAATLVVFFNR